VRRGPHNRFGAEPPTEASPAPEGRGGFEYWALTLVASAGHKYMRSVREMALVGNNSMM
jgi:hypothetical protein